MPNTAEDDLKHKIGLLVSIIALVAAIGGPLTAWGAIQARLAEVEKKSEKQLDNANLVVKHETLIPTLQQDVRDLKTDMSGIRSDIKEILKAVKA